MRVIFIVIMLSSAVGASGQVFVCLTTGLPAQTALEASFLSQVPSPSSISFDGVPGTPSGVPVSGTEWANCGATFVVPSGGGLVTRTAGPNQTPFAGNGLWPTGGESLSIDLNAPRRALGLWIVDSEAQQSAAPLDSVDFLDASGNIIQSIVMPIGPCPSASDDVNFFVGLIASTPITRVVLNESPGEPGCVDGVGIDRVWIGRSDLFPGTSDAFELASSITGTTAGCPLEERKLAFPGDVIAVTLASPAAGFVGGPVYLVAQFHTNGSLPAASFPFLHVDLTNPLTVTGGAPLVPAGVVFGGAYPGGLTGFGVLFQGLIVTPAATNGVFATSRGLDVVF